MSHTEKFNERSEVNPRQLNLSLAPQQPRDPVHCPTTQNQHDPSSHHQQKENCGLVKIVASVPYLQRSVSPAVAPAHVPYVCLMSALLF